jgi:large conductance mechanosensitive channel
MLKEYKDFINRGNVVDLAVAVIIGTAFGAIVNSLVNDMIMPPIGLLLGGVDFSSIFVSLSGQSYPSLAAAKDAGAATLNIGVFLNAVINFLIISFVVFLVVRQINKMKRAEGAEPEPPPEASAEEKLLAEIRDLLKERR